jgi:hypothetical protein
MKNERKLLSVTASKLLSGGEWVLCAGACRKQGMELAAIKNKDRLKKILQV